MAQISEFSLIFMAMGVAIGHVSEDALGLVTLVGLITIAASTYMITYSHELYDRVEPLLGMFERRSPTRDRLETRTSTARHNVILFGMGRYGIGIARELISSGRSVLGVDFSPVAVRNARQQGFDVVYGDATDPEFLAHLPLHDADWVVSAVPEHDTGLTHDDPRRSLLRALKDLGFRGRIGVAAHHEATADLLREAGADLVLMPYADAAAQAATLIQSKTPVSNKSVPDPEGQREFAT